MMPYESGDGGALRPPGRVGFEHRVENDQQLAHGGDDRDFGRFTGGAQPAIEAAQQRVAANRGQGGPVQRTAPFGAAPEHRPAPPPPTPFMSPPATPPHPP